MGASTPTQRRQASTAAATGMVGGGNAARAAPLDGKPIAHAPVPSPIAVQPLQPVLAAAPVRRSPQDDERLVVDLINVVNRLDKQMRCNIRDALARLSASYAARAAEAAAAGAPAVQGASHPAAKDEACAGTSLVVGQPVLGTAASVWRAVDESVTSLLFHQWS